MRPSRFASGALVSLAWLTSFACAGKAVTSSTALDGSPAVASPQDAQSPVGDGAQDVPKDASVAVDDSPIATDASMTAPFEAGEAGTSAQDADATLPENPSDGNLDSPTATVDATLDGPVDANGGHDAVGVTDAPCPIDVNLLAPVDAAANPVAAACQACIVGLPGCLAAFMSCNVDCVCTEAVVADRGCIAGGGAAGVCGLSVLIDPAFASAQATLNQLFVCQSNPACASACNPTVDAGQ
jgi:hypothetical protein